MFIKRHKSLIATIVIIVMNYLVFSPVYSIELSEDYISDGDLMVKSIEYSVLSMIEEPSFRGVEISTIENLGDTSGVENTLLYDRLEDAFIKVLSNEGFLSGGSTIKKKEEEKMEKELGTLTPEEKKEIEKKEETESGVTDNLLFGGGGPSTEEDEYTYSDTSSSYDYSKSGKYVIQYRVLVCKVDYFNMKNWMRRRVATTKMYIRLYNSLTSTVEWADEVYGFAEDIIPYEYVDKLKDSRYIQVRIESGEESETNPILEPLLVSSITAGLILLFSITAKSSE